MSSRDTPQLVLVLHDVQDPGNVGAIVRAAEGCGATGIVCSERTADPFGWKALRGAMGSTFRLPIAAEASLDDAIARGAREGASDHSPRPRAAGHRCRDAICACLRDPARRRRSGSAGAVVDAADERLTIPMRPPVESLNVAIAAALILYEAARQRVTIADRVHVAL